MNVLHTIVEGFGFLYLVCAVHDEQQVLELKVHPISESGLVSCALDGGKEDFQELTYTLEEFLNNP